MKFGNLHGLNRTKTAIHVESTRQQDIKNNVNKSFFFTMYICYSKKTELQRFDSLLGTLSFSLVLLPLANGTLGRLC